MKQRNEQGLTLVELLVVIVLISLIGVVVYKNVISQGDAAKAELNVVRMEKLKNVIGQYRLKFNTYPEKLEDLVKANSEVKKSGKLFIALISDEELNDVWGNPYVYTTENSRRSYVIKSLGSDSVTGGEGPKQDVSTRP